MKRALVLFAMAIGACGGATEPLPPHGEVLVAVDTDLPVPTLAAPADADAWVAARVAEGSDWIKLVREDLHVFAADRTLPTLDATLDGALSRAIPGWSGSPLSTAETLT